MRQLMRPSERPHRAPGGGKLAGRRRVIRHVNYQPSFPYFGGLFASSPATESEAICPQQ